MPQHLPEPRSRLFTRAAADEVIAAFSRRSRGRAFVLFTSYQQMQSGPRPRLASTSIIPPCCREPRPRTALLEEFRNHAELCLVRHLFVLAGRGRAGRAVELRYHR